LDTVLGLSLTPTTVGLVLVEGQDADGATLEHEAFEVRPGSGITAVATSEQAAAAVLRTRTLAATRGQRLHSVGVTWTDDAAAEASLLLESLSESGLQTVIPVPLLDASEALARGIGPVIGYEKTAVCVIEPEGVTAMVVDARNGPIQTAVSPTLDGDDGLISWLGEVFDRGDWHPEGLVVVGSGHDLDGRNLDAMTALLEQALSIPVFAPDEPQLALARGAALASAQNFEYTLAGAGTVTAGRGRPWWLSNTGAATMLVAGVLTFVVSLSLAVGLQLLPDKNSRVEHRDVANTAGTPAVIKPPAPAALEVTPVASPPAPIPQAPPPLPAEVPLAPAPPVEALTIADSPPPPPASIPDGQPADPPAAAPVVPAPPPPAVDPAPVPAMPTKQPSFLRRVLDHVPLIGHGNDPQDQVPQDPGSVYPPPGNFPPQ
jgi:hypothetical protein